MVGKRFLAGMLLLFRTYSKNIYAEFDISINTLVWKLRWFCLLTDLQTVRALHWFDLGQLRIQYP